MKMVTAMSCLIVNCYITPCYIKLTNYAHLNRGSVNLVDMCATYRLGIVGT